MVCTDDVDDDDLPPSPRCRRREPISICADKAEPKSSINASALLNFSLLVATTTLLSEQSAPQLYFRTTNSFGASLKLILLVISKILFLVEEIRSTRSQIYNLWTSIPILLQSCAFETVESVRNTLSTADNTLVLVISKAAFITDSDESRWADVGIADRAFTITFIAEATYGDARLLSAHNEIGMMARHGEGLWT